ncbi:hypothetical protein OTK49_02810 [Vibrio coralliirubri]|uniref:hypothetical protein n=1 Tax=Vibrio coralliirubri TaxID=1516159 RepID=UPI002283B3A3|nr:hypothetical protein [Vibrio coralliirubri]MCY9861449.1 hypothetical protein [Vibrio coralliirubri]
MNNTPHYLEAKWFHTFSDNHIQQQGIIAKMLENNVAVCHLLSPSTYTQEAEILLNLNDYTIPSRWIQFYDTEERMKKNADKFGYKASRQS